jgi:hypothetical protein
MRERFPDVWERLTKNPHFLFLRLVPACSASRAGAVQAGSANDG